MNLLNHNGLAKRLSALVGAVGTAALLGLPALAQVNPNPSIFNEPPYNRSQSGLRQTGTNQTGTNQTGISAVQCPPGYTSGGVGGPIDSTSNQTQTRGSAPSNSNSSLSSDDVASQGINSPANSNANQFPNSANAGTINGSINEQTASSANSSPTNSTMNSTSDRSSSTSDQFSVNNPRPAIPYRTNGPAGTAGREASSNLDAANSSRVMNSRVTNSGAMNNSTSIDNQRSSRSILDGQFSGRNPSAALAFRANGPAGTAGKEASMSLDAFNRGGEQSMMQTSGMGGSYNSSSTQTNQSATPVPVECVPSSGVNNQSAPSR
ncbi:hypothetical protein [Phormidesmis sp. 146-33]